MSESKDERRLSNIIIPIASIAVSALLSYGIAIWNTAELKSQFEQNIARQDESNRIMNDSLTAQLKSLEKKSHIQIIVSPSKGVLKEHEESVSWITSNSNGTLSQTFQDARYAVNRLGFVENTTASFEVTIANVGSNIARIDHIVATIAPIEQNNTLPIVTLQRMPIGLNLAPDGQPHEFTYSFPIKEEYGPSGRIIFQVFYDDLEPREYSFDYEYIAT